MAINLRRDAWKDDRQFDDIRNLAFEIDRLRERNGFWTPSITFGGSASGITYGAVSGRWSRHGSWVFCYGTLNLTNNGSGVGNASLLGLPFKVKVDGSSNVGGFGYFTAVNNLGAAVDSLFLVPDNNAQTARIQKIANGGTTLASCTDTDITNTFASNFVLMYQTDDT